MDLDFSTVEGLRRAHPGWRLLSAEHAPLIVSFLDRTFRKKNARGLSQSSLVSLLEDELYRLKERLGEDAYPKTAAEYLDDWAQDAKGWLRKYYPSDSDEAHYDLTTGAEKAISWIESLGGRSFVGTESRLRLVFDLLRELVEGSGTNPEATIKELRRQKSALDGRIARLKAGEAERLDETAARERFLHMAATAREILSDFREVEQNFRDLDRSVRESVAAWEGSKGELLEGILGRRDAIAESDQGKSFKAFWDFLMSAERQEALGAMLDAAFALPAISALEPDRSLRRVHFDWMEAGERTQRTVARLSSQLRRFLDDQLWMENRRIMELLRSIEARALDCRDDQPSGPVAELASASADIELPMERPLYAPPLKSRLDSAAPEPGGEEIDAGPLFEQWAVDREVLRARIDAAFGDGDQVSLAAVASAHPFERGLAELVAYVSLAGEDPNAAFSESERDRVEWKAETGARRAAEMPRVVFMKTKADRALR